jgi:hypothetical protein
VTGTDQSLRNVPRFWLLAPPLLPALVMGVAEVAEMAGHQWSLHGDVVLLVFGFAITVAIAFVSEIVALIISVRALRTVGPARKRLDLFCVLYRIVFSVAAGAFVAWFGLGLIGSS